jgi:hypothetical protein
LCGLVFVRAIVEASIIEYPIEIVLDIAYSLAICMKIRIRDACDTP